MSVIIFEHPLVSARYECRLHGWRLLDPIRIPGGAYEACLVSLKDDTVQWFMQATPAKALSRALQAARQERRVA
jgi:hypothetical protein